MERLFCHRCALGEIIGCSSEINADSLLEFPINVTRYFSVGYREGCHVIVTAYTPKTKQVQLNAECKRGFEPDPKLFYTTTYFRYVGNVKKL